MKQNQIILTVLLFTLQSAMAQVPFLVKDIFGGAQDANPTNFTKAGDALYFLANDGTTNFELWKTAGDSAFLVKDIYPGSSLSSIRYLTSIGSAVYFSAEDGVNGHELWKAEGDTAYMVKDINPSGNSLPQELFAMGEDLYFTASNGISGRELWRLHNDSVFLVHDIYPGSPGSSPGNFTVVDSVLYFTAAYGTNTDELWMTDGDTAIQVKGIPYKRFATPQHLTAVGHSLYFSAESPANGRELWKTVGDSAYMVKDIHQGITASNPNNFTAIDSILYFTADDGISGNELWKLQSDSMYLVKDINTGINNSDPYDLTVVASSIYFVADEGVNVRKLWKKSGDTAYKVHVPSMLNAATIAHRTVVGNRMYFTTSSPTVGGELWVAENDTVILVKDIYPGTMGSNPKDLAAVGDVVYFTANDGTTGEELWMVLGNSAYLVKDIVAGNSPSTPYNLIAVNDAVYFSADDIIHGRELWKIRAPLFSLIDTKACISYQFGNRHLTQSGRYFDTLISSSNRDSIIILNLVINAVNSDVSQNNLLLTALANNADYQWINCNQAYAAIAGATNKTYTADTSGSYAVEIRQNGCVDTSDCIEVQLEGIGLQEKVADIHIYPNPAKNTIFIKQNARTNETYIIEIYDTNGHRIIAKTQLETLSEMQVGDLTRGIYVIKIVGLNTSGFYKIILN